MGRRSEHSKEELATLIIDTAFELIDTQGYTNLSTRKIASSIGYTVGMLYNLFTSIDDVMLHVNGRILDMLMQELSLAAAQHSEPKQKLRALAWTYYQFSETRFNLWSTLFEYRFPNDTVMPAWYKEKVRVVYSFAGAVIKEVAPNADHVIATALFWSGVHGIASLASHGKLARVGITSIEQLLSEFLRHFYEGLSSK